MEEWIRKGKREIGRFVDCLMGSGVGWVERFNANLATKDNGGAAFQQPHRDRVKRFRVQVTRFHCLKLLNSM